MSILFAHIFLNARILVKQHKVCKKNNCLLGILILASEDNYLSANYAKATLAVLKLFSEGRGLGTIGRSNEDLVSACFGIFIGYESCRNLPARIQGVGKILCKSLDLSARCVINDYAVFAEILREHNIWLSGIRRICFGRLFGGSFSGSIRRLVSSIGRIGVRAVAGKEAADKHQKRQY